MTDPSSNDATLPPAADAGPTAVRRASRDRGGRIRPLWVALAVVTVLAGAGLFLSGYSLGRRDATTPGTPASEEQAFVPFWDAYRVITEEYAGGTVDRKTIIEGAIRGMINALGDPFSRYLSAAEYRKSLQGISGQFEGIGAQVSTRRTDGTAGSCSPLGSTCSMVVVKPIQGSPAEKAGLEAGDVILSIDGASVDGLTLDQAVAKIRGPRGSSVTLAISRGGGPATDITIVRDIVVQPEVSSRTLANGTVGYIKISGFSDTSAKDADSVLRADVKAGIKKFILDLRGNPGGFVTAARSVASEFIASGPIFWQEDAQGTQIATPAAPGGVATNPSIKVAVLIDKGSASASEIVAGALQDTGRGTLIGQTSFGKGTVQEWQPLPNDTGGFRLTIAKWLTPDKRWINKVGLTPDITVTASPTSSNADPVLNRALRFLDAATATRAQRAA